MIRVCFVCLGNICRSPTAEGVFERLVEEAGFSTRIAIDSAGTGAWHGGERADERSRETARAHGIELHSRARQFVRGDFERFDYVIAMDRENLDALRQLAPHAEAAKRITLMRSFGASNRAELDVPDPYYGGAGGFEQVFEICQLACRALLDEIVAQHALDDG